MYQDSLLYPRPAWVIPALACLERHEFLAAQQIARRFNLAEEDVVAALNALASDGLLRRLQPDGPANKGSRPPIYALTSRAAALLSTAGHVTPSSVPTLRRTLGHLAHEAERADLGLLLERLDEGGSIRLRRFETRAAAIGDATLVLVRGYLRRVPLVADAFAVIEVAGRVSALLVELDRGTISMRRMRLKLAGYYNWWRTGGPARRFGIEALRVLVLCPDGARLRALHAAAVEGAALRGSRFLWVAPAARYGPQDPEALFEPHAFPAVQGAAPEALYRGP